MRIFNTYSDLTAALDLPALTPGAYRFTSAFGRAGFVCAACQATKAFSLSGTTGYGLSSSNEFTCYDCCTAGDIAAMVDRTRPFYAYLSGDGQSATSWPGGKLGDVYDLNETRSGFHRASIARFWVKDVHGAWWSARGSGKGMSCTLRTMKTP